MEAPQLVIIGGGMAGLATARRAHVEAEAAGTPLKIMLLEGSSRLGGKVRTTVIDGIPLELGADSFLAAKPAAANLARDLGLELVAPGPLASRTYLLLGGELRPLPRGLAMGVPTGVLPLLGAVRDGLIGPVAAARAGIEPLIPRGSAADPTVAEVTERRLGRQLARRLVAPLVSGIFGAPADEVSMAAAFPAFAEQRSLVLAMARRPKGGPHVPIFLTPREGGLGSFVDALIASLGEVDLRLNTSANSIARNGRRFSITTSAGTLDADAVVVATPATVAATVLAEAAPESADALAQVRYSSSVIANLRYRRGTIGRTLDAAGYLVAPEERRYVAACTWLPAKWPHHPWTDPWVRATVTDPEHVTADEGILTSTIAREVSTTLSASEPAEVRLHRWEQALPIYTPGHRDRVDTAFAALPPGITLAGAAYAGFGIPDCISGGTDAARRALAYLSRHRS